MVKVEQALRAILESITRLTPEEVELADAVFRILAEDIRSAIDIPQLDNSAMDGYAVKAEDTRGAAKSSPKIVEVLEDLRAGYLPSQKVMKNTAIRIMTGAPIPEGADSVVIVEDTESAKQRREGKGRRARGRESVKIFKEAKKGDHVRKRGEDIKKGELVISKGAFLSSAHIGLIASLGKARVRVTRKPKVAILATGDEVIDVDEELKPGKLYSSNTYTLYSQSIGCGAIPKNLGIAKDTEADLRLKIKEGLDCDLLLTSGGVSIGDYDLVKKVLAEMGTDIKFWKVAMRPGKPLAFGVIKDIPVFGLPGNPVSSMVSFEVFVKPVISKMLGREPSYRDIDAISEEDIKKKKGLKYFLRADTILRHGTYFTRTTGPQGSGILKSMALANSLMILPEDKETIKKGEKIKIRFLGH